MNPTFLLVRTEPEPGTLTVCGGKCLTPSALAFDPENCGACGNTCAPTAVCVSGKCGPGVTNVVPAAPGCTEIQLAAADGTIYWTDKGHGTVQRQTGAGGAATTIASNEVMPGRVRVGGTSLFWLSPPATIRKVTLPGGAPADVVTATVGTISDFVVSQDGLNVYYAIGATVMKVPASGGTSVEAASAGADLDGGPPQDPLELAIEGSFLGYARRQDVGVVTLADGVVASCATDPNGVYVGINCVSQFHQGDPVGRGRGLFLRNGTPYVSFGGSISNFITVSSGGVYEIAGDSNALYMIIARAAGATDIASAPFGVNSYETILARGQGGARSLAVDATNVYWTKDCGIYSVAK
jgi:hypothetical protein